MTLATYEKFDIQTGIEKAWGDLEEILSTNGIRNYNV